MGYKSRGGPRRSSGVWKVPAYVPSVQPDLTNAVVRAAEANLGVKLPGGYLELLREQNGGYVRSTLPDSLHSMIWGIGPNFPNIEDEPWFATPEFWQPENPELLIPFDGDGHWYYCFDYRANGPKGEPAVSYVDVELEREEPIAPSFAAFLGMLEQPIEPGTFGVTEDLALWEVVARLASALGKRFDEPNTTSHGYPVYGCVVRKRTHDSIWVSGNAVPRAFAGNRGWRSKPNVGDPSRTGLRFPDYPNVTATVECTEDIRERVKTACEKAGLSVIEMGRSGP